MRSILVSLFLLCSLCANAADTLVVNVNPASQQFVVTLPSNPTTGYQWAVTSYDNKILRMTSSNYAAPQTKLIGAGGKMIFNFALIKGKSYPKSTPMTFTYGRSWEPKSATLRQVTINFTKKK